VGRFLDMAIDVKVGDRAKIVLDFWVSDKGNEYLTTRRFYGNRDGKWFPQKGNGMYLAIEEWNSIIPKLKEMIYYKTAPAGSPPFEPEEEGKAEEREETPSDDF
jgi:hypothetical protein